MKCGHLANILAPFAILNNKGALSAAYKSLYVTPTMIRGCAMYGILEAVAPLDIVTDFVVDTASFVAVIKSLPAADDLTLEVKSGVLHWRSASAAGKLALGAAETTIPTITMPNGEAIELPSSAKEPCSVHAFAEMLELGGVSCGPSSMASAGVYGVLLDNREDFSCLASDDVTISRCAFSGSIEGFPDQVVLNPNAANVAAMILHNPSSQPGLLTMGDSAVLLEYAGYRFFTRPIPAMKQDLRAVASAFVLCETRVELPHEQVAKFIARAKVLSERQRDEASRGKDLAVHITAEAGGLVLSFETGVASSTEYCTFEGLDLPDMPTVAVDGLKLARALGHSKWLGLDHLERHVLVLEGDDPEFSYVISGSKV